MKINRWDLLNIELVPEEPLDEDALPSTLVWDVIHELENATLWEPYDRDLMPAYCNRDGITARNADIMLPTVCISYEYNPRRPDYDGKNKCEGLYFALTERGKLCVSIIGRDAHSVLVDADTIDNLIEALVAYRPALRYRKELEAHWAREAEKKKVEA
jgi:hypothetical protein